MNLRHVLLCLLVLGLGSCGAGGGSTILAPPGGGGPSTLTITTTLLPPGSVGTVFPSTQLQAINVQGAATWSIDSGGLPPGLSLDAGGMLDGTPIATGYYPFVARIEDSVATDTQSLAVGVDIIVLAASSGLLAGDAWTQTPVTLTTAGQAGTVTFSVQVNASGGALSAQNPTAGTATWTPGATGGSGIVDRIRAVDDASGDQAELDMPVMSDPGSTHTASFGSSDVWWIDASEKEGSHSYTTDFHRNLADVGFRDPASTGAAGTTADQLADLWIRVEVLRQINPMFLRNADGSAGGTGLPITFPFIEPGTGYTKPSAGNWLSGLPTRYSQMAFVHGSSPGVVGTAFLDSSNNGSHESDTSSGSSELGVFGNQITPIFNSAYGNPLPGNPVAASDIDALKALLYQLPSPGGRYAVLRDMGRGFARTLAAVIAHETGHSLGLDHTSPPVQGSIMNPSSTVGPSATYTFTGADVAALQLALPGQGKSTGSQGSGKPAAPPEGGIVVCYCRAHQSR